MNIFVLSANPITAAQYMHDRHVVKMILESYQILSTNIRRTTAGQKFFRDWSHLQVETNLDNDAIALDLLAKATHENHPCVKWARESSKNALWLARHLNALCREYEFRYPGRFHAYSKMATVLLYFHTNCANRSDDVQTQFALAMPEKYRGDCVVTAYRNYYANEKIFQDQVKWTRRGIPAWLNPSEFPGHVAKRIIELWPKPASKFRFVNGLKLVSESSQPNLI